MGGVPGESVGIGRVCRGGPGRRKRPGRQRAACPRARLSSQYTPAAAAAETGMVSTQATSMFWATPHRTADTRLDAPTPMMHDEMTWVVLTGAFSQVAPRMTAAAAVSAANPLIGRSLMIRCPIVFMIRHPPDAVPNPMAVAQATITHPGTCRSGVPAAGFSAAAYAAR